MPWYLMNLTRLRADALAGLTTSFALLPECIAFALVAQLAPVLIMSLLSRRINRSGAIAVVDRVDDVEEFPGALAIA